MKIHIDIRDDISPTVALECVKRVVEQGKISKDGQMYCYETIFYKDEGEVWVYTRPYKNSNCFLVCKGGEE